MPLHTGVHTIKFTPTVAGRLRMEISVASDGSIIFQEAAINPGALSAAASEVFGNGALAGVVAGQTATFYVQEGPGNRCCHVIDTHLNLCFLR